MKRAQSDFTQNLKAAGLAVEEYKPLKPLTNWKIGGPARWFVTPNSVEQLRNILALASKFSVPIFLLGGGTNILVSDSGFPGLVIKLVMSNISQAGKIVTADSGATMGALAVFCLNARLTGMEWAFGVPGTVGGAVYGNSNCFGGSTAGNFYQGETLDSKGGLHARKKPFFKFAYDYSILQDSDEILLRASFKLHKAKESTIFAKRKEIAEVAKSRSIQQPLGEKTAGSTFKAVAPSPENIAKLKAARFDWQKGFRDGRISAGFIIDRALGLKGYKHRGMQISEKHANFFINLGEARAQDARSLIDYVKKACENKLDIELEEEIRYIGEFKA